MAKKKPVITDTSAYINRETSWLAFNRRVLAEAENAAVPLLERLKFLAIFESNLDEFYMVRVSGLIEQEEANSSDRSPDGLDATQQLGLIAEAAEPMRDLAGKVFHGTLEPLLEAEDIKIRSYASLTAEEQQRLDQFFEREVFPVCTPLILHPAPNVPFISNRSLNLAVQLRDSDRDQRIGRVKIPDVVPRFLRISKGKSEFVLIEDLIRNNLDQLFPGVEIGGAFAFRVLRDADIEIRELEAGDLALGVQETLRRRRFGDPVLLQAQADMPRPMLRTLMRLLLLDTHDVFELSGMLGMESLWELTHVDRPDLKHRPHVPYLPDALSETSQILDRIGKEDVILSHPFDSFKPVETFVASASNDPSIIGVKQTLYRVGAHSPIVESLLAAAERGKQVAVMVELKARFDEENNLEWARQLERAGVHVTYGFAELKTHAKLCLIVRRERDGIKSYAHIGTGNYNPSTARIYTDLGIFTDDPAVCQDIAELFNYLTGFAKQHQYRQLLVAPINLREGIIERIEREIQHAKNKKPARIMFKLNSLVDPEVVDALYDASRVGIQIDLIVRGICCLRPGVPGMSENIRVISIVGRFLEHSRIYSFENGGAPEVFIGSADLMRRNLDRRVEVLVPIRNERHVELLKSEILDICLKDNVNAWELQADGTYSRVLPAGKKAFSSHEYWVKNPLSKQVLR